ncbi:MAG: SDR family oxidoreductase [Anaerolineales bacterium]
MSERTVLLTGAAGGIGQATAAYFTEKNWQVIGVDRSPAEKEFPSSGHLIKADVSKPGEWKKIIEEVTRYTDQLDALVNNAAIQITKPILETTIEEWNRVLNSNLRAVFLSAKSTYPLLKTVGGGAIVNVSSVHALVTSKDIASYAASKGGMLALTRAMAIEFASADIRVNAILPGAVDTKMLRDGMNREHAGKGSIQDRLENLASKTVSGKIGKPEEIARAIYFLADHDQSSFMTGQSLVVDGGATAKLSTE